MKLKSRVIMTVIENSKLKQKSETIINVNQSELSVPQSRIGVLLENGSSTSKWKKRTCRLVTIIGTTLLILVLSLSVGMACGRFYKQYLQSQRESCPKYASTSCNAWIPFNPDEVPFLEPDPITIQREGTPYSSFSQEFELDIESEGHERISVPYKGKRRATFVHDFGTNTTSIIDLNNARCFVLPLNTCHVMPAYLLFDLVHKSMHGSLVLDSHAISETYYAILPPISIGRSIGCHNLYEQCIGKSVYKLIKINEKSHTEIPTEYKFAEFAGKGVLVYEIGNYKLIERFEDTFTD